jgi:hypothetical protein
VEDRGADALGLVEADQGFHQRVVQGIADGPDRGRDALEREPLGEPQRGVLGDPASLCQISSPGTAGRPARLRSHSAIRSGVMTRSVVLVVAAPHAGLRVRCCTLIPLSRHTAWRIANPERCR